MEMQKVDLSSINGGAAMELFQAEFQKVMRNIDDISIDSEDTREITLKFKIKPTKDRTSATVAIQSSSKLGSFSEHQGSIFLSRNGAFVTNPHQFTMFEKKEANNG